MILRKQTPVTLLWQFQLSSELELLWWFIITALSHMLYSIPIFHIYSFLYRILTFSSYFHNGRILNVKSTKSKLGNDYSLSHPWYLLPFFQVVNQNCTYFTCIQKLGSAAVGGFPGMTSVLDVKIILAEAEGLCLKSLRSGVVDDGTAGACPQPSVPS